MKKHSICIAGAVTGMVLILAGCAEQNENPEASKQAGDAATPTLLANTTLTDSDGTELGVAKIVLQGNSAELRYVASGIPAGRHGFHLHETGDCGSPDFTSAGGHLNPLGNTHGRESEGGKHLGDLPNLEVDDNGNGRLTASLEGDPQQLREWLFDSDGTAVVIHANADDYKTDPAGDAGPRIACGVLEPGKQANSAAET